MDTNDIAFWMYGQDQIHTAPGLHSAHFGNHTWAPFSSLYTLPFLACVSHSKDGWTEHIMTLGKQSLGNAYFRALAESPKPQPGVGWSIFQRGEAKVKIRGVVQKSP